MLFSSCSFTSPANPTPVLVTLVGSSLAAPKLRGEAVTVLSILRSPVRNCSTQRDVSRRARACTAVEFHVSAKVMLAAAILTILGAEFADVGRGGAAGDVPVRFGVEDARSVSIR